MGFVKPGSTGTTIGKIRKDLWAGELTHLEISIKHSLPLSMIQSIAKDNGLWVGPGREKSPTKIWAKGWITALNQ